LAANLLWDQPFLRRLMSILVADPTVSRSQVYANSKTWYNTTYMEKLSNRDFKVLSDREHVLCRPGMYLGSVSLTEREQWIYGKQDGKFHYGKVNVIPALLKCSSELIDNSIDVAIDTNFKYATKIKVKVDSKSIEVEDDGIGIPCVPPEGIKSNDPSQTCACLAWTKLKAGTSFDDSRQKIGTNGVGSSCVNVFSKLFIGWSDDGKHKQKIECTDNMSNVKASKVTASSGKSGVTVYCEPDLARFGVTEIDETHINLIYQRLVNLSICYPKIKFIFNGERINVNEKKFAQMFSDNAVIESTDNATVCVFPNELDEFKFYACVNGIDTTRGGTHVDNITMEIANRIRDKLSKKYKSIRPGDVKSKLGIAIMLTGFVNPQFDSQTKESLANSNADVLHHLDGKFDFDAFAKKVLKNDAIIEPIVETFKIKEELKARQELKRAKKVKVRSDKYMAPIGEHKYLALCEGASAMSGISSCLGRNGFGWYSMRGVPLNSYSSSMQKIVANAELKDILNILELDISKSEEKKTIDFEKVLITSDNDADGQHITAMLIGWFKRFAPNLFDEGRICKLITPLITLKDKNGKIAKYFFNVPDFKAWEAKNSTSSYKLQYAKGLGSWERADLIGLFDSVGLENFILEYKLDAEGSVYIEDWLGNDPEKRKQYLREYTFDINQA
jgi:DNA gyrase/topoisomerase IV subunit B